MSNEKSLSEKEWFIHNGRCWRKDEDIREAVKRLNERQFKAIDETKIFSSATKLKIMKLLNFKLDKSNQDYYEIFGDKLI